MKLLTIPAFLSTMVMMLLLGSEAFAEFGVVSKDGHHSVDTGAGLVVGIRESNGGIFSIKLRGDELQTPSRDSGIASGVGSDGTTTKIVAGRDTIVVAVATDKTNGVVANMVHYYIFRSGENRIYMATYVENQPTVGELRWIGRLKNEYFPKAPKGSDIRGNTGAIESKDVFRAADGTSRSKYYGNDRAMDLSIRGVSGDGIGVFMAYGNRESSSGGPFFRDIQNQTGSAAEVYNYMNSGHNQTEPWRLGVLHGLYVLCFTEGEVPEIPDMSFVSKLRLKGYVSDRQRGHFQLAGIRGMDDKHAYTVGFDNPTAQYWVEASEGSGEARLSGIKPGSYRVRIYKGELAVYEGKVNIKAGAVSRMDEVILRDDPSMVTPLWRIGDWDGTPMEFRNGGKISLMHPSDPRMDDWEQDEFVVGKSEDADFPSCQWMDVNGGREVKFWLDDGQIKERKVRVGITAAFAGCRPRVSLNGWSAGIPKPSSQPRSRSFTIGTYRSNNQIYTFDVPASAFRVGENTLGISPVSGQKGSGFLSPGYTIDCVDLH